MKLEFLDRFSKNALNIKFHENPSSWSPVIPRGSTDGRDEVNWRFSQFCCKRLKTGT
jgi:hypothetical protein